jgi:hypothetical protein
LANDEAGIEILNNVIFLGDDASHRAKAGSNDHACQWWFYNVFFAINAKNNVCNSL